MSEETKQKIREAYKRRVKFKRRVDEIEQNKEKDIREGLAEYLGL